MPYTTINTTKDSNDEGEHQHQYANGKTNSKTHNEASQIICGSKQKTSPLDDPTVLLQCNPQHMFTDSNAPSYIHIATLYPGSSPCRKAGRSLGTRLIATYFFHTGFHHCCLHSCLVHCRHHCPSHSFHYHTGTEMECSCLC